MCQVRIPSFANGRAPAVKNESLARCIEFAAARTGTDEFRVTEILSYFLEQLADENTRGRSVVIPGFGGFWPVPDRKDPGDGIRKCRVRFHAAVGFAQQVRHGAPPLPSNKRKFQTYQTNHSAGDRVAGNSARVFTAMAALRQSISAQLAHAR